MSHDARLARPAGVILAGGRARRLGGIDKGLVRVGGDTILGRVAAVLRGGCSHLALNANGSPERFGAFDLPVIGDSLPDRPGPLAGVLAALDWGHAAGAALVVTAPADTPFLPADLVARLADTRAAARADIACARSGGATHPVIAIWPTSVRDDLRRAVRDDGIRKVGQFIASYPTAYADWGADPVDPFFNVNTR